MKEKISEIKLLLQEPKNIVICMHRGPDGDALGSSLAWSKLLTKLNHQVTVISPNDYASFLYWMPGNENVVVFSEEESKSKKATEKADIIFLLDLNSLHRLGDYIEIVKDSSAIKIMIDHHQEPDIHAADIIISNPKSCSTSELLYEIIIELEYQELIDKDISECLYVGIMTDTGSFKFSSTTSKTHSIVSELINNGVQSSKIHDLIYDNYSEKRMKLLGYCINEKLQIFKEYSSAIISLTKEDLDRFDFQKGDTEGVVNYALAVEGIIFAIFIAEKEGVVKMSFRSKGDFKVNEIAKKYFNGGGHINAAGGISDYNINETINKLKNIFKNYKNELLN